MLYICINEINMFQLYTAFTGMVLEGMSVRGLGSRLSPEDTQQVAGKDCSKSNSGRAIGPRKTGELPCQPSSETTGFITSMERAEI